MEHLYYWLASIRSRCAEATIFVVGTHDASSNSKSLFKKMQQRHFLEVPFQPLVIWPSTKATHRSRSGKIPSDAKSKLRAIVAILILHCRLAAAIALAFINSLLHSFIWPYRAILFAMLRYCLQCYRVQHPVY